MDWVLDKELDNFGEDIDIHAKGLPRSFKMPGYRKKILPRKHYLKLVVDNTKDKERGKKA